MPAVIGLPVNFADDAGWLAAKAAFAAGKGGGNAGGGNSGGGNSGGGDPGNSGADNGDDGSGTRGDDGGPAGDGASDVTADPGTGTSDAAVDGKTVPEPSFDDMTDDELEAYVIYGNIEGGAAIAAGSPAASIVVLTPKQEALMIEFDWTIVD